MESDQRNESLKIELYKVFDRIHRNTGNYNLNCLGRCNGDCEDGAILLLPYENEYISSRNNYPKLIFPSVIIGEFHCGFIADNEPDCIGLCKDRKHCNLYPLMPLDCLSFPVIPKFNIQEEKLSAKVDFYLATYCPLFNDVDERYVQSAKNAWNMVLPFVTREWMDFYNTKVCNYFSKVSLLPV